MIRWLTILSLTFALGQSPLRAQPDAAKIEELSTLPTLFSAHAVSGSVRLNWSLERQSPTLVKFRIYRGYEEVGNFAVLTEIPAGHGADSVDYTFSDTAIRNGVSYYYKISALGQSDESVFPVVISATPMKDGSAVTTLPPVALLPGSRISLYVRKSGHVKLETRLNTPKVLVDDELRPGIYEFDSPAGGSNPRLRLTYNDDFYSETDWPVK